MLQSGKHTRRLFIESLEPRRVFDASWHNAANPVDVDADGQVTPVDAVYVINHLNAARGGAAPNGPPFLDVVNDGQITPLDAISVINYLNAGISTQWIKSAQITIANRLDGNAEYLSLASDHPGIESHFNSESGTLVLTGHDTPQNYAQAVASIRYENRALTPTAAARILEVTMQTSSGLRSSSFTIPFAELAPPNLALDEATTAELRAPLEYDADGGPIALLGPGFALAGDLSITLAGATVINRSPQDGAQEVLTVDLGNSSIISSYDPDTGMLTLSGAASAATYIEVLRTLVYENQADAPLGLTRRFDISLQQNPSTPSAEDAYLSDSEIEETYAPIPVCHISRTLVFQRPPSPSFYKFNIGEYGGFEAWDSLATKSTIQCECELDYSFLVTGDGDTWRPGKVYGGTSYQKWDKHESNVLEFEVPSHDDAWRSNNSSRAVSISVENWDNIKDYFEFEGNMNLAAPFSKILSPLNPHENIWFTLRPKTSQEILRDTPEAVIDLDTNLLAGARIGIQVSYDFPTHPHLNSVRVMQMNLLRFMDATDASTSDGVISFEKATPGTTRAKPLKVDAPFDLQFALSGPFAAADNQDFTTHGGVMRRVNIQADTDASPGFLQGALEINLAESELTLGQVRLDGRIIPPPTWRITRQDFVKNLMGLFQNGVLTSQQQEFVGSPDPVTGAYVFNRSGEADLFVDQIISLADAKLIQHGVVRNNDPTSPSYAADIHFANLKPGLYGISTNYQELPNIQTNLLRVSNLYEQQQINKAARDYLYSESLDWELGTDVLLGMNSILGRGMNREETQSFAAHTIVHELGHSFGLLHNQWDTSDIMYRNPTPATRNLSADFTESRELLRIATGQHWEPEDGDAAHDYVMDYYNEELTTWWKIRRWIVDHLS